MDPEDEYDAQDQYGADDGDDGSADDPGPQSPQAAPLPPSAPPKPEWWKTHPGFAESLVPVWGPAREAVADAADGHPWEAAANVGLAALDVVPGAELLDDGVKLGSHTWPATRAWLTKTGFADKGQVVHHAFFERNRRLGKYLPDWFKNQPFNLKAMPSAEIHDRMEHGAWGKPKLNPLEQYWHGTPSWFKFSNAGFGAHGLLGEWQHFQDDKQSKQ